MTNLKSIPYRPEIDGLRAISVLAVILYHAGFDFFSGGYVGVDVFFVISGYLITGIILAEIISGKFSFPDFFERRARRILPPLFVVLVFCTFAAWVFLTPPRLSDYSESLLATLGFSSNFYFWQESGYFNPASEDKPLLHTWSLAIEEQYYLLFPFLLLILWRQRLRKKYGILFLGIAGSIAVAEWGVNNSPVAAFYLLPTRFWELLVGSLLAFLERDFSVKGKIDASGAVAVFRANCLSFLGAMLVAYSVVYFDEKTPFPGLSAVIPTLGAAFIIASARPFTVVGSALGTPLMTKIGLMSFSLYLWHFPVFTFFKHFSGSAYIAASDAVLLVACTFLLAWFTYVAVETRFRNRQRISTRQLLAGVSTVGVSLVLFSFASLSSHGFENYFVGSRLTLKERELYARIKTDTGGDLYEEMYDNGECVFWSKNINEAFINRFSNCTRIHGAATVILGDSHAMNLYNLYGMSGVDNFVVGLAAGGCRVNSPHSACPFNDFESFFRLNGGLSRIIYHQSGSYLILDSEGKPDSAKMFVDSERVEINARDISILRERLERLSNIAPVIWIGPFPEPRINFDYFYAFKSTELFFPRKALENFQMLDEYLESRSYVEGWRFRYVSFDAIYKFDLDSLVVADCITFRDVDHLSKCGETYLAARLKSDTEASRRLITGS
jgi:peptidoglycan/LPS O-acetylase OafA/YrhL